MPALTGPRGLGGNFGYGFFRVSGAGLCALVCIQTIYVIGQYFGNNQSYLQAVNYGRGLLYDPLLSCVVLTHENISCLTRPGVGSALSWQVHVCCGVWLSEKLSVIVSGSLPSVGACPVPGALPRCRGVAMKS